MIVLTEVEERCRVNAISLILKREKKYPVFGSKDIFTCSLLCRISKIEHPTGEEFTNYLKSGIILAMTVSLTKIYFMSHSHFYPLKSEAGKLDDFATFIETHTLKVV